DTQVAQDLQDGLFLDAADRGREAVVRAVGVVHAVGLLGPGLGKGGAGDDPGQSDGSDETQHGTSSLKEPPDGKVTQRRTLTSASLCMASPPARRAAQARRRAVGAGKSICKRAKALQIVGQAGVRWGGPAHPWGDWVWGVMVTCVGKCWGFFSPRTRYFQKSRHSLPSERYTEGGPRTREEHNQHSRYGGVLALAESIWAHGADRFSAPWASCLHLSCEPACRILPIIIAKQFVQFEMVLLERVRVVEEALGHHGKKLLRRSRTVLVQHGRRAAIDGVAEVVVFLAHDAVPAVGE